MTILIPLRSVAVAAIIFATSVGCRGDTTVTAYTHLSDTVVHLSTGDSVEFQATGPAVVPNKAPGLLVTFRPYFTLGDTVRVRAAAIAFFQTLPPSMTADPAFVVMRAVDVPAARRNKGGYYDLKTFGVVLERHGDGRWYGYQDSIPAY